MSSEHDNSGPTDADNSDRKQAADGPVLELRDMDSTKDAVPEVDTSPMIDSSLVGAGGGLSAAEPKARDENTTVTELAPVLPSDDDHTTPASVSTEPDKDTTDEDLTTSEPDAMLLDGDDQETGAEITPSAAQPAGDDRPKADAAVRHDGDDAAKSSVPPASPRRGGFAPLFLGGVVAAGLGAGAAWWAMPQTPAGPDPAALSAQMQADLQATADSIRQDAVTAATEAARAELAAQAQELETRSVEAAQDSATAATEAAIKAAGASLTDQGTALTREATQAATQAAMQAGAAAGAEAARKLIAEAPASDQLDADLQTTLSAQASQLQALDDAVKSLQGNTAVSDLGARIDDLAQQVSDLADRPAVDPDQVQRLQSLADDAQNIQSRIEAAAQDAEQQLASVRDQAAKTEAAAEDAARKARTAAAAATLAISLDTSVSAPDRSAALENLEEAGIEPSAALTAPVVPLDQLQAQFDDAARDGLRAALRSGTAGGGITNFLRVQTGARSVAPRQGNDPDAILSRAGDAVGRGDIPAALSEIDTLPEPAQQAMTDWTGKARAWIDARNAVNDLTSPDDPSTSASAADTQATNPATQAAPAAPTN